MSGSIFGKNFTVTTWGESHGKALGVVIDGCPSGIPLTEEDIQIDLDRRKPGSNTYGTKRKEGDKISILSGVFEGKTTGTPISLIAFNEDQRSRDYSQISECYRPGHADYTFDKKYGFRDYRGGGRSSGRETLSRVAGGVVAKKILKELGIEIMSYTVSIGNIEIDRNKFDIEEVSKNPLYMPDRDAYEKASLFLDECIKNENSAGGIIETVVSGMPVGIGEPVFDKLDANLGKAMFSIGAVKGVEIGQGFLSTKKTGFENNDFFHYNNGKISKLSNNAGGILGGMSDGSKIVIRTAIKPTPSIHKTQQTVNKNNENIDINIKGRHDPVIVPRAVVVTEAMTAITIVDLIFSNMFSNIENIKYLYKR